MSSFTSLAGRDAIEREAPWAERDVPRTIHAMLTRTAERHGDRPAISFQLLSGVRSPAETLTWREVHAQATRAANLFRSLGVGEDDVVALILPNAIETATTLLGAAVAGIVCPINPLLSSEQMAALLRETGAKVVVTLASFPRSDVAQKADAAVAAAPGVETVLELDLRRYLSPPQNWLVPLLRPRLRRSHRARVLDLHREIDRQSPQLGFPDAARDRVAAYFHTGGTTGMPKIARHRYDGLAYNGWLGERLLFSPQDNVMCPLPLFHVFAANVILMSALASGAHMVMPTPAGYRGDGVFANFWKLIERWRITFIIAVPTAISALMQRPVDADVSSVKTAFSGSAPLPVELFRRFESATGVEIIEGYGLTEATCLVSCNPLGGEKRIGSVGLPFPYCDVRILRHEDGQVRPCATEEVGEICVASPGVNRDSIYVATARNRDLFHDGSYLRTGDLGRLDADGYLWITGRAKDLIIRGGHNIDPATIEDALIAHEDVVMVGAVGQPDAHSGELPCAYVELRAGARVSGEELLDFARARIVERAAIPKHVGVLEALPRTAVGKIYKPALRQLAIARVFDAALAEAGVTARVVEVVEDPRRGLMARVEGLDEDRERIGAVLGAFAVPWEPA